MTKPEVWEEHPEIYHYTNQAALKGILETQSLRATHYAFLNDYREIDAFRERFEQLILPQLKTIFSTKPRAEEAEESQLESEAVELAQNTVKTFVDGIYNQTFGLRGGFKILQPFFVSFCGHSDEYVKKNGLLSQWRCYGKDAGYAIIFDTEKLHKMAEHEENNYQYEFGGMEPIFYDTNDDEFNRKHADLKETLVADFNNSINNQKGPHTLFNKAFIKHVPWYKHRAFREEQEVRLVLSPTDEKLRKMRFRGSHKKVKTVNYRENLAPYIILFEEPEILLPIKRIIVGPHADREMRKTRLEKYLDLKGLEIEVTCSETPVVL